MLRPSFICRGVATSRYPLLQPTHVKGRVSHCKWDRSTNSGHLLERPMGASVRAHPTLVEHLRNGPQHDLAHRLEMRGAGLDLLRGGVDVAEPPLERRVAKDRAGTSLLV